MRIALLTFVSLISMNCAVKLSANCRNFSLEIVYFTALGNEPSNIFLSPFTLWTLMFGVALGASGISEKELRRALILFQKDEKNLIDDYENLRNQVVNNDTTGVSIKSENTILLDDKFQINDGFSGNKIHIIKRINFNETALNAATETASNDIPESGVQVKNVVTLRDSSETRMIFANGMYFKGLWALPFDKSATAIEPFYDENGEMIGEVNMMYQRNRFPFANIKEMNAFVLELPYGNEGRYSMLILLPWTGKTVREVYESLSDFPITHIFYKMYNDTQNYGLENIDVRMPRFRIGTDVELIKPFNDMNVNAIFVSKDSSFGRITNESVYVSSITQITDIEVTESGIVASDTLNADSAPRTAAPGYNANKPFIYFIVEKTTISILFAGVYSKPTVY